MTVILRVRANLPTQAYDESVYPDMQIASHLPTPWVAQPPLQYGSQSARTTHNATASTSDNNKRSDRRPHRRGAPLPH